MVTTKDAKVAPAASADGARMDALASRFKAARRLMGADASAAAKVLKEHGSLPFDQLALCSKPQDAFITTKMERTTLTLRQHYLPRHLNHGGIVFGGDILRTLERAATAAAVRLFAPGVTAVTTNVRALVFIRPILARQLMHVEATVVATWPACVCVMARASVNDPFTKSVLPCHSGVFFVTATDPSQLVQVHVEAPMHRDGDVIKCEDGIDEQAKTDFCIAMTVASDLDTNTSCGDF